MVWSLQESWLPILGFTDSSRAVKFSLQPSMVSSLIDILCGVTIRQLSDRYRHHEATLPAWANLVLVVHTKIVPPLANSSYQSTRLRLTTIHRPPLRPLHLTIVFKSFHCIFHLFGNWPLRTDWTSFWNNTTTLRRMRDTVLPSRPLCLILLLFYETYFLHHSAPYLTQITSMLWFLQWLLTLCFLCLL